MAEWSNRGWTMSVRSKQIAVMEFLRAEKVPAVDIHRRVRLVYGDTMDAKTRGDLGYIPAWLEIQGLMEESLRAAVTGLGIEILGALCARAEPAAARIRLCSLVPQKFTSKMYAELCRFMETCHVGQMAEWPAVPRCLKDADETRGHAGIQPKNLEDECSVIPEEEAKHLENAGNMPRKQFKQMTLAEKVELIKNSDGRSQGSLAKQYGIARGTVQNILKRKAEFMQAYEENEPSKKKRANICRFEPVNDFIWEWFCRMRASNVPISGPMIREKALAYAESQGIRDFKASTGWLDKFKTRHNINCAVLSGEGAAVKLETVHQWKERLPGIIELYDPKDIFNLDESGLFYRALPDKTLRVRGTDCKGGIRSKERLTAMLCVNMKGEFEKPLIIGRCEKPRCFKHINTKTLPVMWKSNKRAWMTAALFKEWLERFNEKIRRQKRNVLLFLDNATCHPCTELSNVKLVFFPQNSTSHLQPLDQGIIKTMKTHYQQMLLRRVIEDVENGLETTRVSVLDACLWVAEAVKHVRSQTVTSCFGRSGFTDTFTDDPKDEMPLADLVRRFQRATGSGDDTPIEYVACDNELVTSDVNCMEDDSHCPLPADDDNDDDDAENEPSPTITTRQAIEMSGKLRDFFIRENMPDYVQIITQMNNSLLQKFVTSSRQMDLMSFFIRQDS